ncbi:MAG TPA: hypothetical protein VJ818_03805, partial [Actinomycetota bacterium]|nr:hypothetical protein [Actinomycetota bacterium]
MRKAAFVLACASLLASCTSRAPHTSASSSSTPSAVPTVVASATRKPVHVVSARQMLYVYKSAIWLYDAKSNHARQVTQGGTVALPRWIDADHFSFVAGGNTLRIVDLGASTVTDVLTAPGGIQAYG